MEQWIEKALILILTLPGFLHCGCWLCRAHWTYYTDRGAFIWWIHPSWSLMFLFFCFVSALRTDRYLGSELVFFKLVETDIPPLILMYSFTVRNACISRICPTKCYIQEAKL